MDQDPAADRAGIHRAEGAGARPGAAHRLRGGGLPEHLRVLGGPRGDVPDRRRPCTRRCDFCQIATGKPEPLDTDEPRRVAESVAAMGLRYATVTGVARDDLPDGGAWLYAQTCAEIHAAVPGCGVELLIPDFNARRRRGWREVFAARPEVLAHNIETVPRIFRRIRPGLPVRAVAGGARPGPGGRAGHQVQPDPRPRRGASTRSARPWPTCARPAANCSPSPSTCARPRATTRWSGGCRPRSSTRLREEALGLGFAGVMSGPLVRSSYRAGRLYAEAHGPPGRNRGCRSFP